MAEFLVLAKQGYTNPDPVKDKQGCYKRGDIVVVRDDGHEWGNMEGAPDFVIVKVPGLLTADAEVYAQPESDANGNVVKRRRYGFITGLVNAAIGTAGKTTVAVNQLVQNIVDSQT